MRSREFTERTPHKPRFVAGSIGPTNRTCSLSPDVNGRVSRFTFDALVTAYHDQLSGLLDGGVDLLLVETIFDTLNPKAALAAMEDVLAERGQGVPILVSGTITDASGRTLSGQTLKPSGSRMHAPLLAVGFNCALGAEQMRPFVETLATTPTARQPATPMPDCPTSSASTTRRPATGRSPQHFAAAAW